MPAGLERTWLDGYEDSPAPECLSTVQGHLNGAHDFPLDPAWRWAAGGLNADIRDLYRWADSLLRTDRVLTESQRNRMKVRTSAELEPGVPTPYAMGLRYTQTGDTGCGELLGHTGSTMGAQSDVFLSEDGLMVGVVQNDFIPEVSEAAHALCAEARRYLVERGGGLEE